MSIGRKHYENRKQYLKRSILKDRKRKMVDEDEASEEADNDAKDGGSLLLSKLSSERKKNLLGAGFSSSQESSYPSYIGDDDGEGVFDSDLTSSTSTTSRKKISSNGLVLKSSCYSNKGFSVNSLQQKKGR
jgi:hypothetical protein